jgi:type I restriction enzyme M protein
MGEPPMERPQMANALWWSVRNALADKRGMLIDVAGNVTAEPNEFLDLLDIRSSQLAKSVWEALAVRDPDAEPVMNAKGKPEPDLDLRDQENVPLPAGASSFQIDVTERVATPAYRAAVEEYVAAEVRPFVPDAWVDEAKTKIGYEIPLTRHFYKYVPSRPLEEIDAEIKALEAEIQELLREVAE